MYFCQLFIIRRAGFFLYCIGTGCSDFIRLPTLQVHLIIVVTPPQTLGVHGIAVPSP